tara:strand:- start:768 stop:1325 length:558 start_codon:yes stop_codon:yes gene_type:complete
MNINGTRRKFVKFSIAGMALFASGALNVLPASARQTIGHEVSFKNAHTGESFRGVYRIGSYYVPSAFRKINRVLRDHRTGDIHPIDPELIDTLARIQRDCRCGQAVEILSGYRSPKTNAMLRSTTNGVAKNSFHLKGQAADIRVPGSSTSKVRNTARALRVGGVGYYPKSGFVHVDTGSVRTWTS